MANMRQQNAKAVNRDDFEQFDRNPSTAKAMQSMSRRDVPLKNGERTMIVGSDSGDVLGDGSVMFLESKIVDRAPFSKVYAGQLSRMLGLPKSARRVLEMVHTIISSRVGVDFVPLHPSIVDDFGETMSRRTFDRGINELLAQNLIYRSRIPHNYFVDVTVMFNGNRVVLATVYERERLLSEQQITLPHATIDEDMEPDLPPPADSDASD